MPDVEVFQTDDRYAGPVIGGRYQVLASAIGPTFYAYDHGRRDAVRDPGGATKRFDSVGEALTFLGFPSGADGVMNVGPAAVAGIEEERDMAKVPGVAAAKAAKKEAAPAKVSKKVEAPNGPAPGVKVGAYTKELILRGLGNDDVISELQKSFPDKANSVSNVNFYRTKLRAAGQLAARS